MTQHGFLRAWGQASVLPQWFQEENWTIICVPNMCAILYCNMYEAYTLSLSFVRK